MHRYPFFKSFTRPFFTGLVFLIACFAAQSQAQQPGADAEVIIEFMLHRYEFIPNTKTGLVEVKMESETGYSMLKKQDNFVVSAFFDDYSSLSGFKAFGSGGARIRSKKVCGYFEQDDIFHSDAQYCAYPLGELTEGRMVRVVFNKLFTDAKYFTRTFFHQIYYSRKKRIEFVIPDGLEIDLMELNFEGFDINKATSYDKREKQTSIVYEITSAPELKHYGESEMRLHVLPHVLVTPKKSDNPLIGGLMSTTSDVYNWYASLTRDLSKEGAEIQTRVNELVAGLNDPDEKIRAIYYWVQDNIKYVAYEDGLAGYKPEEALSVFNKRFGDCKGMANLTRVMLNMAGFDARLAWVGTQRIPYTYDIASLSVDNHMICAVNSGDGFKYLDATMPFAGLDLNSTALSNKEVLIENGEDYIIETYPEAKPEFNQKVVKDSIVLDGTVLKGKGQAVMSGEFQQEFVSTYRDVDQRYKQAFIELIIRETAERISSFKASEFDSPSRESALAIDYEFANDQAVTAFGDELYIQLPFPLFFDDEEISKSHLGYQFPYNGQTRYEAVVELPAGYKVQSLPETLAIENANFHFSLAYKADGRYLTLQHSFTIKDNLLKMEAVQEWAKALETIKERKDDVVTLRKE